MTELMLVEPSKDLQTLALAYKADYINHNETHINGSCSFMQYPDYEEWLTVVKKAKDVKTSILGVPATTYFTLCKQENRIVGSIQLRHSLNEEFAKSGGHIGYGICPSQRKKGYAVRQLAMVLQVAKEMGLENVLITCDQSNIASAKVAMRCEGVLLWEGYSEEDKTIIQKYRIDIT